MKTIAVMTTGGDAPGMNAAIRGVVRTALYNKCRVMGIEEGYSGLIENLIIDMDSRSVGGIINKGGTILRTVRSKEFKKASVRKKAYANLKNAGIEGIAVIGGDGSRMGAYVISKETGIPTAFIPASIDNDVYGTDYTIGFDTAVNTALEAIDKIRDTATSHERVFIVEVMGREHGFLALEVGVTGGAEVILLPEYKKDITAAKTSKHIKQCIVDGKKSSIVVMAEGVGLSADFAKAIEKGTGLEVRTTVLGYIQRGGTPTADSRKLGLSFGYEAVMQLLKMKKGQSRMVGVKNDKVVSMDMNKVIGKEKKIDAYSYKMNKIISS